MAYTLKTSGIATNLTMCVAVDQDGTTIREFVNATVDSQKTVHANVSVGTSSWKSTPLPYFETKANGDFAFYGVTFGATKPSFLLGTGCSYFAASAGAAASTDSGSRRALIEGASGNATIERDNTTGFQDWWLYGAARGDSATIVPNDGTTKFSIGGTCDVDDTANFYGLESGSLAADGTDTNGGFGVDDAVNAVGGSVLGGGHWAGKWHIVCVFNTRLTLGQMQSLHDDWFGTLFDVPLPPPPPVSSRRKKPAIHPGQNPVAFGRHVKTRRNTFVPPDRTVALTGVAGTGALGTLAPSSQVALTGAAATGAVGTTSSSSDSAVALTGVEGAGVASAVSPALTVALTGVAATGAVGSVVATATPVSAVGSRVRAGALNPGDNLFKLGRFYRTRRNTSTIPSATGTISGVQATGSVGTVAPGITVQLTGVAASGVAGAVGSSAAPREGSRRKAGGVYPCTGPYSFARYYRTRRNTESLGTAVQSLNGVAATAAVGSVTSSCTIALTGVAATGAVGSVGASQAGNATLTTVAGVASVGSVSPSVSVALTGVQATGAAGTIAPVEGVVVALTGVQATGEVGALRPGLVLQVTGVTASATIGTMVGGTPGTWVPVNSSTVVEGWTPIIT